VLKKTKITKTLQLVELNQFYCKKYGHGKVANRVMHVCDEALWALHAHKCVFGHFKTAPPTSASGGEKKT